MSPLAIESNSLPHSGEKVQGGAGVLLVRAFKTPKSIDVVQ